MPQIGTLMLSEYMTGVLNPFTAHLSISGVRNYSRALGSSMRELRDITPIDLVKHIRRLRIVRGGRVYRHP